LGLAILTAGALSYGTHVAVAARFNAASLIGWLLSASTTLLAIGIMLRLTKFLSGRLSARRLSVTSVGLTLCALILAASSLLIHYPQLAAPPAADTDPRPGPPAVLESPATSVGAATEPPPISLWWLGETPVGASTAVPDGEAAVAADPAGTAGDTESSATTPPTPGVGNRTPTHTAHGEHPPEPRSDPTPLDRYRALLERGVVLIDTRGAVHGGRLTGINKDGVTLQTNVMMFGQPILAHRFFLHKNIDTLRADPDADPALEP
jgi:hypothetical protein